MSNSSLIKLALLVLAAVVLFATLGSNPSNERAGGCLWVGGLERANNDSGSSGGLQATNPFPSDSAVNVSITARLSWASVSGMTSYDVYFGTTTPPDLATNVPNTPYRTRYNPGTLAGSTVYYWRVDSKNAVGTYIGTEWSFTTKAQAVQISNPSPATGSTDQTIDTDIFWDAVIGADSYDVYFGISYYVPFVQNQPGVGYDPGTLSYNTIYYWKVAARDASNNVLVTGPVWNFRTQTTLTQASYPYPADGATNCTLATVPSWLSAAGATDYDVYFGTTNPPPFAENVPRTLNRTRYYPGTLSYGQTYYWQVNARDGVGGLVLGEVWSFSTKPDLPDAVSGGYPANGSSGIAIRNLTLTWTAAAGAASYDVYFSTSTTPTYRANTSSTSYYPGVLVYNTTYYWKINSRNSTGVTEGTIWNFSTMVQVPPTQASEPYPFDNGTDYPINTQLSWLSGSDASTYDVYFGITSTPPLVATDYPKAVYRTRYSPVLTYSTTYYWKVDAKNDGGLAPGVVWKFTTMGPYPSQVSNPDPISGTESCPITQTLGWSAANMALSYDIYFGTVITLTGAHFKLNTTNLGYTPSPALQYNTTYYWRVDSRNSTGVTTGLVWPFSTLRKPEPAYNPSPYDGEGDILPNAILTWSPATRATSYNIQFSTNRTNVENSVALVASTTITNYAPPLMTVKMTYYWRVDAFNLAGTTQGDIWSFTILEEPAQVTGPVYPGNGASDIPITVTLQWGAALRAKWYDVYIDTNNPPTGTAPTILDYTETSLGMVLEIGTLYYWQVDARNEVGTTPGIVWSFTTLPLPGQPTLLSPFDTAEDEVITATLTWTESSKAESYNIYIDTLNPPGYVNTVLSPTTQYTITLNPNTLYYWQIGADNSSGETKSITWTFTTWPLPGQVGAGEPLSGTTGLLNNQTVTWTASTKTDSYEVYFGSSYPPPHIGNQTGLTYDPGVLLYSTQYFWRIDSRNTSGVTEGNDWTFTTLFPPDKVTNPVPGDQDEDILDDQILSWTGADRADSYDVYLDVTNVGWTPVSNTTLTDYDPPALLYSTKYYWKIDSVNAAGTVTGDIWTLTTKYPPIKVTSPAPNSGDTGIMADQVLSWASEPTANSYDIYLDTTDTGMAFITNTVSANYDPPTLLYSTKYYWRVDSVNEAGPTTGDIWTFTTLFPPAKAADPVPDLDAFDIPVDQELGWSAVIGADSYDVYIDVTTTSWTPVTNTAGTAYTPVTLDYLTLYYWRVDTKNVAGTTTGDVWEFTTRTFLGRAENPTPAHGLTGVSLNPSLGWSEVDGAESYDVYFGITMSPSLLTNVITPTITYGPVGPLSEGTVYYWRVDPVNSLGKTTGYLWQFTTLALPDAPATPSPSSGATGVAIDLWLSWSAAARADSYDVYLGTVNPPDTPEFKANISGMHYHAGALQAGAQYYWRVDAKNSSGTTTGAVWNFTTIALGKATVLSPANSDTNIPATAALYWTAGDGAISYDVYFGTTLPGTPNTNTTGTSYDPPGVLLYSTSYQWRIDSKNGGSTITGDVWTFTTEASPTTPPDAVGNNPTPAIGAAGVSMTPQLSWPAAARAISYDVYLDTNNPPATLVTTTTETYYNPAALAVNTPYYWSVDAKNDGGITAGPVGWNFTTLTVGKATVPSPASGASNVYATTLLSWNAAAGAASYKVYLDTSSSPAFAADVSATIYEPAGRLDYNILYYWRVDTVDALGGITTGDQWTFTTEISPTTPPTAVTALVYPSNGATSVPLLPTLIWTAPNNSRAWTYDVRLGADTGAPVAGADVLETYYTPGSPLLPGTLYYWRVDAKNDGGTTPGAWWSFITISAPGNNFSAFMPNNIQTNVGVTTCLAWNDVVNATNYDVYFDTVNPPAFAGNVARNPNMSRQFYDPPGLLSYSTDYYWRVVAKNDAGETSNYTYSFTTESAAGAGYAPYSTPGWPANNSINVELTPTLIWNANYNNYSYYTRNTSYDVYLGTTDPPAFFMNTAETSYTPTTTLLANTKYYWRVDGIGTTTATGTVWNFTTLSQGPAQQFNYSYPGNTWANTAAATPLVWSHFANATSYDVYFGTVDPPAFAGNIPYDPNLQYQKYDPPGTLDLNTTYYWQIGAKNDAGIIFGPVWYFSTYNNASAPSNRIAYMNPGCPANTATNVSLKPSFDWYINSNSTAYINLFDFRLGTANPPPIVATISDTSYTSPTALSPSTLYYWRVDPRNNTAANTGTLWSFTTGSDDGTIGGGGNNFHNAVGPDHNSGWTNYVPYATDLWWNAYPGAASYDVYFEYNDSTPDSNMINVPHNPDIPYQTTRIEPAWYKNSGNWHYWNVVAKDSGGGVLDTTPVWQFIWPYAWNNAFQQPPTLLNPEDGSAGNASVTTLMWCSDYFGYYRGVNNNINTHYSDVYLDTVNPPLAQVASNLAASHYTTGTLTPGTYYWQVVEKNASYTSAFAPVWSFTVGIAPIYPQDSDTNVPVTADLVWSAVVNNNTYDVYLDTVNPPTNTKVATGATSNRYQSPALLTYDTTYYWQVAAIEKGITSTVWTFTTESEPSGAPVTCTYISPAYDETFVPVTPTYLSWNPANGAEYYNVYFGTAINPPFAGTVTNSSYISPGALALSTLYHWRIEAVNTSGSFSGPTWRFNTELSAGRGSGFNPFGSTTPAHNETGVLVNQVLYWDAVTNAASYQVYMDANQNPPTTLIGSVTNPEVDPPGLMAYGATYYWQIKASNSYGSVYDRVRIFTTETPGPGTPAAATYISPADQSTDLPLTVTLYWNPVQYATSYDVCLGTTNPPAFAANTLESSYTTGVLSAGQLYYWRIDAGNGAVTATGTSVWYFTTLAAPGANFTSLIPLNNATDVPVSQYLDWADVLRADSYDVYFGTANPPPLAASDTADSRYDPPALMPYETVYYWKVAAKNSAGSTFSPVMIFTTETSSLGVPPLVSYTSPSNNAIDQTDPVLVWTYCAYATSYDVYLGNTNPPEFLANTTETSYTPGGLNFSEIYYWRIDALNGALKTANPTVWKFTMAGAPTVPGNNFPTIYPTKGLNPTQPTVLISWSAVPNAASYDVYFGTTVTPPLVESDNTSLYYDPPGCLDFDTNYYWRLVAKNSAGSTSSEVWPFHTKSAPAQAPRSSAYSMSTPGNNTVNQSLTPVFRWNPYNYISYTDDPTTSFEVCLDTVNPPVAVVSIQVESTYTPSTPLLPDTAYYWRINNINSYGSMYSAIWNFTTVGQAPSQTFSYSWPPNNSTYIPVTAMFGWQHTYYLNATSYDIYYGTTNPPSFVANTLADFRNTTYMKYDPPGIWDYDTTYYWQIVGKNDAGEIKGPVWSFKTEAVTTNTPDSNDTAVHWSPASGATNLSLTPTLDWYVDRDDYCDRYRVLCDTNATPTTEVAVISETSYTFTTPLSPGTRYYWRIQSGNGASGTVYWTSSYAFTYYFDTGVALAQVTNGTPGNGSSGSNITTAVFWNVIAGAHYYDVYFDEAPTPTGTTKVLSNTTDLFYDPPGLLNYGATYNWRVDAKNLGSTVTGADLNFTTEASSSGTPDTAINLSPADQSINQPFTTTLRWNVSKNATSYNVRFGPANPPPAYANTVETSYLLSGLTSGLYYWRIDAGNGTVTTTGTVWYFIVGQFCAGRVFATCTEYCRLYTAVTPQGVGGI